MSIYSNWFEDNPQQALSGWLPKQGMTPAMQRYYGGQYNNLYNQYSASNANRLFGSGTGAKSWGNYLNNYGFNQNYQNLPSYMRGWSPRTFSPSQRWINF